jgi:hypothetical protein
MGGLRWGGGTAGRAAVSCAAEGCRLRWLPRETVGYLCTIYVIGGSIVGIVASELNR